jgi:hypothetical protein
MVEQLKKWFDGLTLPSVLNDSSSALILFFFNLFLVYAIFFPKMSDINPWDEAAFVHSGQELIEGGEFPRLSGNPLASLFFGITYLPFRNSTFWMLKSITLSRILLFTLVWWSTYLIAKEVRELAPPIIPLGILFVTPLSIEILRFPTDPLFASLAAFSLWQLLRYKKTNELRNLAVASLFMGLSALARADGLVLFLILFMLGMVINFNRQKRLSALGTVVIPFATIVGGVIIVRGLVTGDFSTGLPERTYTNFESGQQAVFSGSGELNAVVESRLEARRLFGTAEENNYSPLKAIRRNPDAYAQRLLGILKALPSKILSAYGIRFTAVLLYVVIRGLVELIREKQYLIFTIFLLWPAHLASGLIITIFRTGHLQFSFYIVFILAAIGIWAIWRNFKNKFEIPLLGAYLAALSLFGLLDNKLAIFYGTATFFGILLLFVFLKRTSGIKNAMMLIILLCGGLIIRGGFPSPILPELGDDPKEKSIQFLVQNIESGTSVAAGSPGVVLASKLRYAGLNAADVPTNVSPLEFKDWLYFQGIEIVYVDHSLYQDAPKIWELIQPLIGDGYERLFEVEQGNFQILRINS